MKSTITDIAFTERRRVPVRALLGGIVFLAMAIQGFRMESNGIATLLLVCSFWYLGMAWLNRNAGSQTLMILKDNGIWFFNADGLVPYTAIEATEVESYSGIVQMQLNTVIHIAAEKADTLPNFDDSRWKIFFKMPSARKGKGFRKHLVVFNYGGLRDEDGKNVDYDDLEDELAYRIEKAHQKEHELINPVYVPSSSANDALSPVTH
ncbi:hypothetical protein [Pseudomonas cedrina]|uniref:hypothetical protein n=1 Tax=Pseudomonas cedrina TaxID=651740 RepID=UPI00278A8EA8|nr:hypothetical protein [Pseudomonas cedrina]MDQ0655221.1 hypothetical protein [Pseudomonas cedrina]